MTTFNQAMLARDRTFAIRIGDYGSQDIQSASFNYGYISGDTLKPGSTTTGTAKVVFTDIIPSFQKLDKIYPEIGLLVGSDFEWVKMGEYYINDISIDRNKNTTELDLMDGMFRLNQEYKTDLKYPAQIRDVVLEICAKTGVELETDDLGLSAIQHHIEAAPTKKSISFREVLSQAIQLLGFSAFFNRKGKLEIRGLAESGITITADSYYLHGLKKSEVEYQIAGITCKKDDKTLTVGLRTGRSLELENSFMNQVILDDLYYGLKNIKYYPYSLNYQGHLKLEVGQWVTIRTNKSETYKVPVLSQSFHFKGGLSGKISADSKAKNDTQYSYAGFLTKKIEQMSTEIEAEVQQQLEYAEQKFEAAFEKHSEALNDGIEQVKADVEKSRVELAQDIDDVLSRQSDEAQKFRADFARQLEGVTQEAREAQAQAQSLSGQLSLVNHASEEAKAVAKRAKDDAEKARLRAEMQAEQTARFEQDLNGTKEKLERIQVGGRNYVRGSALMKKGSGNWSDGTFRHSGPGTSTTIDITDSPVPSVTKAMKISGQGAGIAQDGFNLALGAWTVSYWIKGQAGTKVQIQTYWRSDNSFSGVKRGVVLTKDGWQRVSFTSTTEKAGNHSIAYIYLQEGNEIYVTAPQLEQGTVLTDWRQAPEDTDGLITAFTRTTADYQRTLEQNSALLTQTRDKLGGFESQSASWIQKANGFEQAMNTLNEYTAENGRLKTDLKSYVRTETAERVRAERQALSDGFVAKSALTETVEGLHRKFEALYFGNNLYIIKNAQAGYLLSDSMSLGAQHATRKEFTSDFIRVFPDEVYTFQVWVTVPPNELAWRAYQFYDANKKLLGSRHAEGYERVSGFQHVKHLIRVPAGAAYLRVSARLHSDGKVKVEHSSSFNEWSLAPEDSESMVTNLTSKIADYKQTLDGLSSSLSRVESKIPSDGKIAQIVSSQTSSLTQTVNSISASVSSLNNNVVRRSELNLDNNGFVTKVGKTVDGRTLATMIAQNERDVRIIAEKLKVTGDMLVDGAVTARKLDVASVRAGILTANSITSHMLEANAVMADKLKVDSALIQKLTADDLLAKSIVAQNAFITAVQAVDLSASRIKGGLLQSLNGATVFNLNNGQLNFYTDAPALRRILQGYPTQFVKFATGTSSGRNVGVTVIGSNRNGTESSNDGGFVGIRAWNGQNDDSIDIVGDTVRLASSAFTDADGWDINTLPGRLNIDAHRAVDRVSSLLCIGDVRLWRNASTYISLKDILHQFNHNFKHLINITGRGDVILTWDSIK